MKKIKRCIAVVILGMLVFVPANVVQAEDFASNENYWLNKCSTTQSSASDKTACEQFRQYYEEKRSNLNNELSSLSKQIANIESNINEIESVVKNLNSKLDYYNKSIEINEANIRTIATQIEELDTSIAKKQKEIDKRNDLIKDRMLAEQATIGTNIDVEIIMGASDLVDMIRKVNGLQKITESDQNEISTIQEEKKKLDLEKSEQKRLKEEAELKKQENEKNKEAIEILKSEQEKLLASYQQQEADLAEKVRSVKVDISTLSSNIIAINPDNVDFSSNNGFIMPVQSGYISAGTWYYPGGGAHLGMDKATSIGTPVYAPADGIILYANNPVSSNSGYLGNWSGYPQGGGNTIHMLTQVNGTTYAISFFHLSQEGFAVRAGARVSGGQRIALTGNSGNSSGPHCHIELINLGSMSVSAAISQFQRTADFAWGNGWGSAAVYNACGAKGTPCRVRPETVFH